jgi:hypothetical protein
VSLKDVDITAGLRRLADRRIEDAMREGKFDNLSGKGQPLELEPMPAEEDARLMWWALRILRNNDFAPDEIRWRKMIETLKAQLATVRDERRLRALVKQVNELVLKLNTLGTNAISSAVTGVQLDVELARLRGRTPHPNPLPACGERG